MSTIFFDLGGTLLKMRRSAVYKRILEQEGYYVEQSAIDRAYLKVEPRWIGKFCIKPMRLEEAQNAIRILNLMVLRHLKIVKEDDERRIARIIEERWKSVESEIKPALYPEVIPLLSKLYTKFHLGIITNAPPEVHDTIHQLNLDRYMKSIVISGELGYSKPNPEIFRYALKLASAKSDEAIHIGDIYEADIIGARSVGMEAILIDRYGNDRHNDCIKVSRLDEIEKLVQKSS